jgi:hypothetical protein
MRIGEWNRITGFFSVETVLTVIEETQRGDVNRAGYVPVERAYLERQLEEHLRESWLSTVRLNFKLGLVR